MDTFIILLVIILVLIFIFNKTYFESYDNTNPTTIIIFVSKTCGHCITYNSKMHNKVEKYSKDNGINLQRVFADEDNDKLFENYNIEYVPACVIIKGNAVKKVDSSITPDTINSTIKYM